MKTSFMLSAFLVAVIAPSAYAESTASASLDWSSTSISFLAGTGTFQVNNDTFLTKAGVYKDGGQVGFQANSSAVSLSVSGLSASAHATRDTSAQLDFLDASATALFGGSTSGEAESFAKVSGTVTLEPNAVVEFSIPYNLSYSVGDPSLGDFAESSVELSVSVNSSSWKKSWEHEEIGSSSVTSLASSNSDTLSLLIRNTKSTAQTLQWTAFAETSAYTVTPVPEPETYAMLLAGLGLMGFVARRRDKVRT
jgi:hypothetical protein